MLLRQQIRHTRLHQTAGSGRRWMSVRPEERAPETRKKVTIQHLLNMKRKHTPITMLTAYDFPTGRACEAHGVDMTLVGDSLAQVCLGYDATTRLTLDEMVHHCRAVARGSKAPFLVGDMPFGTYQAGVDDAVRNAVRLVREGGVDAVKIEGGVEYVDLVKRLTTVGIPVMGHIGLTPQRQAIQSGYRVQGKSAAGALSLVDSALALEAAGGVCDRARGYPTRRRGAHYETPAPCGYDWHRRRLGDGRAGPRVGRLNGNLVWAHGQAVRDRSFPSASESYEMPAEEAERFVGLAGARGDEP
ncbi:hypothetical protein EVJ58_g8720 [Rhodofomes roseus]|uniref:3-methyl-2-oxobutanoate hydroxymethyltransferase n=1 Tax=Rhodofomes roseus TaxID=34475 RepID=A0A4Y9XYZ4_9APHY|nr:hypothetical protein EVJ58_g8720 [Rhodofomes roseus]